MEQAIDQLLARPGIWRASETARHTGARGEHIPTGFSVLDTALPGGGFPSGALTEVLHDSHGMGELRLAMPALARLSRGGRWIAMIAPPHIPYAPGLSARGMDLSRVLVVHPTSEQQSRWALEQALRAGTCAAVLAWPEHCDDRSLRRFQLAAETGNSLGLLFRDSLAAGQHSPAALRLRIDSDNGQRLGVRVLKCRGATPGPVQLDDRPAGALHEQQPLPLHN
ncbi:translesion DNA synthesis-associated protein ImuA [Spiribacter pallidus]|jgi:cell division inhibitor SulA/protein ImuA|uniref:Translesion DNA synthesis-associated protein ImuA n=1 Tax=Spiribacter pallidus TaxID=1987936 RepID=A0ABV3TB63_9GAMM